MTAPQEIQKRFRPGCYAIVNSDGRVLLVRKTRGPFTGSFDLPGGGMDHGENHLETVARELSEELGLDVAPGSCELFGVFGFVTEQDKPYGKLFEHLLATVYSTNVDSETFARLADGSILGTEIGGDAGERTVATESNFKNAPLTPICREALEAFLKRA